MSLFGSAGDLFSGIVDKVKADVPDSIYRHAQEMNLVDTALAAVIRQAVQATAGTWLASSGMGQTASSLLGGLSSVLGGAQSLGVGQLLQKALDSTDIDEQLRDALIDGFGRYLRENAGRLAQIALTALKETASQSGR